LIQDGSPKKSIVLCGHGEFLSQAALELIAPFSDTIAVGEMIGPELSRSAPAFAVAALAANPVPAV